MRWAAGERLTMAADGKIPTDGGGGLGQNPFGALSAAGLPVVPKSVLDQAAKTTAVKPPENRGRVDVRRETGNRGGKTVTVIDGFIGIGLPEKEQLAKKMRAACGCGGTVKDGVIEIQGDHVEHVIDRLKQAGWPAKRAGG